MNANFLVPKLRNIRNFFRKVNAGFSISDKAKCFLLCCKVENKIRPDMVDRFLNWAAKDGLLDIELWHRRSGKKCKISIRAGNHADYFIFWEFLGGFYDPPVSVSQIVDCGANIGLFALHAGLIFPKAQIICFEPEQKNFKLLQKNLEQNNIKAQCFKKGVWSSKISGYFHLRQAFDGFISLEPGDFSVECEVPEIAPETWLKMDVEGAEYEVLPTVMRGQILPAYISMEVHDFHLRGGTLTDLMKSKGYSLRIVTDGSPEPMFAEVTARCSIDCSR